MENTANPLRPYLRRLRITQAEFAETIGVHPATLSRHIRTEMPITVKLAIAAATNGEIPVERWAQ